MKIAGEDYTVKAVIANSTNGTRYYDHKLTQIEKGKLLDELVLSKTSASPDLSSATSQGDAVAGHPTNGSRETSKSPVSGYKDKRLISILQVNDEEIASAKKKMREILDEVRKKKGYDSSSKYQGSLAFNGAAPSKNGYYESKEERKEVFDNGEFEGEISLGDFVDNGIDTHDLGWQLANPDVAGRTKSKRESIDNINNAIRRGKGTIKMYRAVNDNIKEDSFRNGDWITPSKNYAEEHIELQDWKGGRIIEKEVSIDDVWWDGNDINEWGYDDGENYAYKNVANNRKLTDIITRDDKGNVIMPSRRFDEEEGKTYFREKPVKSTYESEMERKREAAEKLAQKLNMGFEAVTNRSQIKNREALNAKQKQTAATTIGLKRRSTSQ